MRRFGPDTSRILTSDLFYGALADLALSLDPLTQNRFVLAGGNPIGFREWDGHEIGGGGAATDPSPQPAPAPTTVGHCHGTRFWQ